MPAPALGLDEPHFIAEVVGVVIRLVVDDENLAVGRTVLQHGKQGIVQLLRIAQDGNDDRQPRHGKTSWDRGSV